MALTDTQRFERGDGIETETEIVSWEGEGGAGGGGRVARGGGLELGSEMCRRLRWAGEEGAWQATRSGVQMYHQRREGPHGLHGFGGGVRHTHSPFGGLAL